MEKFMKVYSKIFSVLWGLLYLIIIISLIIGTFMFGYDPTNPSTKISSIVLMLGFFLIAYIPLCYYAWKKENQGKKMKILTKITTIAYPLYLIVPAIGGPFNILIFGLLVLQLLPIIPLYYFAWRK